MIIKGDILMLPYSQRVCLVLRGEEISEMLYCFEIGMNHPFFMYKEDVKFEVIYSQLDESLKK